MKAHAGQLHLDAVGDADGCAGAGVGPLHMLGQAAALAQRQPLLHTAGAPVPCTHFLDHQRLEDCTCRGDAVCAGRLYESLYDCLYCKDPA